MKNIIIYLAFTLFLTSCGKQNEWLSVKNEKNRVVPETLRDLQALLDITFLIHHNFPIDGLVGTDNIYLTDVDFNSSNERTRNLYVWNTEIWEDGISLSWNNLFPVVFRANAVLDGLNKITLSQTNEDDYSNIKGQALFYRAIVYYNLSQLFCRPYNEKTALDDLGLPLRNTSDVNILLQRASLQETYDFILDDAKNAVKYLPITSEHNRRPNKAAATALLAKIYLVLEDYENALLAANESLSYNSTLLDFNSDYINMNTTYRFESSGYNHPEILFYAQSPNYPFVQPSVTSRGFVNQELMELYDDEDLRKSVFYIETNGGYKYRGGYTGDNTAFCGIATNEIYLIKAESAVRGNQLDVALEALNALLAKRYRPNTFDNYNISDPEELLDIILQERRKELIGVSNLRWEDLRRLNKDPKYALTLKRTVNSVDYTLDPNSNKYTLPIPQNEIEISGLIQNPR